MAVLGGWAFSYERGTPVQDAKAEGGTRVTLQRENSVPGGYSLLFYPEGSDQVMKLPQKSKRIKPKSGT